VRPGVRVLFVGINPGVRSALTNHHFAGPSNRFWKLLYESGLVPEPMTYADDDRLPDWGFGVTNMVPRPTPGIDTLRTEEYVAGLHLLRKKVRKWKPVVVAFVGVTLYRFVSGVRPGIAITTGPQPGKFEGAQVFVLPNPSGRNANYSYAEMLAAFAALAQFAAPRDARIE
jgi:TDG/mug DNA glycosylase family protein